MCPCFSVPFSSSVLYSLLVLRHSFKTRSTISIKIPNKTLMMVCFFIIWWMHSYLEDKFLQKYAKYWCFAPNLSVHQGLPVYTAVCYSWVSQSSVLLLGALPLIKWKDQRKISQHQDCENSLTSWRMNPVICSNCILCLLQSHSTWIWLGQRAVDLVSSWILLGTQGIQLTK
jgi:hypothetical protein